MAAKRILVVEDDVDALELLLAALRSEGYEVRGVTDGRAAESALPEFVPELALVDIDLGDGVDGYTTARRLRAGTDLPLIFLSGFCDVSHRLAGYQIGADDYVTKPFSFQELVARMRAVLRRSGNAGGTLLAVGDIVLDHDAHTVSRGGHKIELTAVEFTLLEALLGSIGTALSKPQLLAEVWGFDHFDVNLVEVYVSSLRRKLEAHGSRVIHTIRGVGYVTRAP